MLSQDKLQFAAQLARRVYDIKPDWLAWERGDATFLAIEGSDELADWRRNFEFLITSSDEHLGFGSYARELMGQMLASGFRLDPKRHLILTGHSLGGAVATIIAAQLQGRIPNLTLVTFGSPRPGGRRFRERFKVPHFRYVHGQDVVPHLPSNLLGFRHTTTPRTLSIPHDSALSGVADHAMDGYAIAIKSSSRRRSTDA